MLTMRQRAKSKNWYIRGSVTLGDRWIDVAEYSAGTADADAARHLMNERERLLREELMFGPRVVVARAVIADAFEAYLGKPKSPNSTDIVRIGVMNERIGAMRLSDPKAAWHTFREAHLTGHAPAGQDRYRSLLQSAINVYNERHDLPPIKLKAIAFDNQRIRFFSHGDRDRLIAVDVGLPAHLEPIARTLRAEAAADRSFETFMQTIRRALDLSYTHMTQLGSDDDFEVRLDGKGLAIETAESVCLFEQDDLRSVRLDLQSGLLTKRKAEWSIRGSGGPLVSLLSVLPSVRPVMIQRPGASEPEYAIEPCPQGRRRQYRSAAQAA